MLRLRSRVPVLVAAAVAFTGCDLGGDGTRNAPTATPKLAPPRQVFSKPPYMGVRCVGRGNFIGCDQVSLALWLRKPATAVRAYAAGDEFDMSLIEEVRPQGSYWEGDLKPAGLQRPPFDLPSRSHWYGRPRASALVRVTTRARGGEHAATAKRVQLAPGFG